MHCDVASYISGESPGNLIDVSLRCRLLFAGGSPGNLSDVSCWVDTRAVVLNVSLMYSVPHMRIEVWDTVFGKTM